MKRYALLGLVVLAGCGATDTFLVSTCTTGKGLLSSGTECELKAVRLTKARSSSLEADSLQVRVSATFTVQTGRVTVVLPGCPWGGTVEVAAGTPKSIECNVTTSGNRIVVKATPGEGGATGFVGHVTF